MKKILLTLGFLFTTTVTADELLTADKELIDELKQFCTEIAEEDGTNGKDLKVFILECINEELESEGYKPLPQLD